MATAEQLQKANKKRKQNEDVQFPSQEEMGMSDNEYMDFQFEQGVYEDESGVLRQLTPEQNEDRLRTVEGEDIPFKNDIYEGESSPGFRSAKATLDPLTDAKRTASKEISPEFKGVFWLRSVSPEIDFPNLNKHSEKGKK
tara:strand:- start:215 stop:634 length:420 start_codon:yes stop_codon:yes gene_type:complete